MATVPGKDMDTPQVAGVERSAVMQQSPSIASTEDRWATPPSNDNEKHGLDHTPPRYRKIQHVHEQPDEEKAEHVALYLMAAEESTSIDEALSEKC
jgi:hypothetical protein